MPEERYSNEDAIKAVSVYRHNFCGLNRGRLSKSEDFARIYRAGKSVANKYLVLYYFDRLSSDTMNEEGCSRVGFSVSKRVGGAVERNRVKRVLREAFRMNADSIKGGMDFVLIARTPIVDLLESEGFGAIEGKLIEVFQKASLYS